MRSTAIFLLLIVVCSGCKKKGAGGGPPEGMATQVIAVTAARQPMTEVLSLVGTVRANEAVDVKSQIPGLVEKIHFDEGQQLKKDDIVIEIDAGKLAASLSHAEAQLKLAESKFARARDLSQTKAVSQQELDEARALFDAANSSVQLQREQLRDTKIRAPFAGIVGARTVSPGQVIAPQQLLTTIADLDPVKVEFNVPERFTSRLATGQKIELTVAAFGDQKFTGEVYLVAPQIDAVTRTGLVKARVPNGDLRLKPGMFASLELTVEVKESAIVVPEAALMSQGEIVSVIVVDEQMTAQMRPVKVGLRHAGTVEIVEGLAGGETVVVEGWQKTRPGGKVKLAAPAAGAAYLGARKMEENAVP